ncbi:AraC family transcriptional regulator [Pseudomonas cremoricolorata]|uniref:AraC family transcriptional regulator n=1 Tax=Pseudomonas cremoricolorata TaxID=157783 RepID=A0A089WT79_9PSED|nr:AraC family transcriptional regulator [Pseudomonas cremoricolorata]AIR90399.1 AraC family transcriptional regulator [Pseudomonas cremoricolorata]
MSDKDTISMHLVREALLQSCQPGADTEALLTRVGIDPSQLHVRDARVPSQTYAALWRQLARHCRDELFAMDARGLPPGSLAFMGRASLAQASVGEGIETALAYLSLALEGCKPRLAREHSVAQIVLLEAHRQPARAFTYFTLFMLIHGLACWLSGRRIAILAVDLRAQRPAYCDDYQVMFSENLRFAMPNTRLIIEGGCLDQPIRRTADELQQFLAEAPGNILVRYRDPSSLGRRIRADLLRLDPALWPDAERLARQLCLSVSTLRRRLADEGQTYQGLKDSVRRQLAVAWLAEQGAAMDTIAERLGYADSSSFYKAFRKWFGCNPGHYRMLSAGATKP